MLKLGDIITRDEVQKRIWALTENTGRERTVNPDEWKKKWLPSHQFVLMQVPLGQMDQPIKPHFIDIVKKKKEKKDPEPIFIDKNRFYGSRDKKYKRIATVKTYVVDGKHRAEAAKQTGQKFILAWVGIGAVQYLMDGKSKWWSDSGLKELQ